MHTTKINEIVNNIVWFIPFRRLRNAVRDYLIYIANNIIVEKKVIKAIDSFCYIPMRMNIKKDNLFYNKYLKLISNLDNESILLVNSIIFSKILQYNEIDDDIFIYEKEAEDIIHASKFIEQNTIKINDNCFSYFNYLLPINSFEACVFYEQHHINHINNLDYIKNKDIIDAGGFIGDSALILSNYTNKNVYSFEPMDKNYKLMLETIEMNMKNNIIPIKYALGDKKETIKVYNNPNSTSGMSLNAKERNSYHSISSIVNVITLDEFVEENNINVGLIKTDLEGFEQKFLNGAMNTIISQKPILLISIYHSYTDFFDIKPLIENLNLGYKFKILKSKQETSIVETVLLAEIY